MSAVQIPRAMFEEIESLRESNPEFGYESVDEYVREAVREKFMR